MDQSPLAQQARPETFKPKIVGLYEALFKVKPPFLAACFSVAWRRNNFEEFEESADTSPRMNQSNSQKASGASFTFSNLISRASRASSSA